MGAIQIFFNLFYLIYIIQIFLHEFLQYCYQEPIVNNPIKGE